MTRSQTLLDETAASFQRLTEMAGEVDRAVAMVVTSLKAGGRVFFCGNGGSAADAQHLAAELLGKFLVDRAPLAAIALTTNTSALTAIANDFSYEEAFERQLRGLGRAGDVVVGISTSGNSRSVVATLAAARAMGIATIGMTGARESAMTPLCDLSIRAPSTHTPRIQEMHIALGHAICELVEAEFV